MELTPSRALALLALASGMLASILGISAFAGHRASQPIAPRAGTPSAPVAASTIAVQDTLVTVDFQACTPERARVNVAFGSTTLAVVGRDGDNCRLDYGGEVENPNWDGKLTSTCRVPARLGLVTFAKGDMGLDLSPISRYCAAVR